jgi:kynureninase
MTDYQRLDVDDSLGRFREQFSIPLDGKAIYLCGNSLGLQPRRSAELVEQTLADWRKLGVFGHHEGKYAWLPYHELLTELSAELVGARPREVVNMNSLTVNLHLMMVSFYRPTRDRHKIMIERGAFPSDRYAVSSQVHFHGYNAAHGVVEMAPRPGETLLRTDDIEELIEREGHSVALVLLPGLQYYSGQIVDIARITKAAHAKGCVVGVDLAHAAGNIPLALHDWNIDFAAWCSYKYLNAGPGSVAGCFVHERHLGRDDVPRFAGWWGHDKATRFQMGPEFHAIDTAEAWQVSNPPILSLAAVLGSLEVFKDAGMMKPLRDKSVQLTGYLESLLAERLGPRKVESITPADPNQRGAQLSLRVIGRDGRQVHDALERANVVCDWREPDVIRVAPTPLYNRFEDCWRFVDILAGILK